MSALDTFDPVRGPAREPVDEAELRDELARGTVVEDPRRRRPRYFDGRFLTARDLTRDQQYFLTRQADLGQLGGGGVVQGLQVTVDEPGRSITIAPGHGTTRTGELVALRAAVTVDVTDVPTSERLDRVFGLDQRPRPPHRTRTGLFTLALRPVEYTANPVASYPTSITGERKLEDGDIVEATAVTLLPFEGESAPDATRQGRARLAKQIFLAGRDPAIAADALPVAVVALERGTIAWLDVDLARREAGADTVLGFGLGHRARREAFLRQFRRHLLDVNAERADRGLAARFAARDHFEVLPPVGELPREMVEVRGAELLQWFFPPEMYVELGVVADDEVPGLFEEGLALAPVDLGAPAAALEAVPMLILAPVARADFGGVIRRLNGITSRAMSTRLTRPLARARPIDGLYALQLRGLRPPAADPAPVDLAPWAELLASSTRLLYVRRRQFAQVSFVIPRHGPLPAEQQPSNTLGEVVRNRLAAAGERDRFDRMMVTAGSDTLEACEELFSLAIFGTKLFVNGVMAELAFRTRRRIILPDAESGSESGAEEATAAGGNPAGAPAPLRLRPLTPEDVAKVGESYRLPGLGTGIPALNTARPALDELELRLVVAQSLRVPHLDLQAQPLTPAARAELATTLEALARDADVNGIRDLIDVPIPAPFIGDPFDASPASQQAVALGEGTSFRVVWNGASAAHRTLMEGLLANAPIAQRLTASGWMMEHLILGWGLDVDTPTDVTAVLEALRAWRPQMGDFVIPTMTSPPPADGIRLTGAAAKTITDNYTALAGVANMANTTQLMRTAGFPDDIEAFRVVGLAGQARVVAPFVAAQPADRIQRLVAAMLPPIAQRDLARLRAEIRRTTR
jgi:hypothetical protein